MMISVIELLVLFVVLLAIVIVGRRNRIAWNDGYMEGFRRGLVHQSSIRSRMDQERSIQ